MRHLLRPPHEACEWSPEISIPKSSPNQDQQRTAQTALSFKTRKVSIRETEGFPQPWGCSPSAFYTERPSTKAFHKGQKGGVSSEALTASDPHCRTWQQRSRIRDTKFAGLWLSTVGSEEQDGCRGFPTWHGARDSGAKLQKSHEVSGLNPVPTSPYPHIPPTDNTDRHTDT